MTFQEQFKADLDNIFFSLDNQEFATLHNINGKDYKVIINNDKILERNLKDDIENIFLGDLLFYINKDELGFIPRIDGNIQFDDTIYQVANVNDNFGILEIVLKSNIGR